MRVMLYASLLIAVLLIQISGNPFLLTGPETVADPLGTGNGNGDPFTATSIIGAIVVFSYYWLRFSEWPGPGTPPAGFQQRSTRHSTTWIRYTCWGVIYALFMVGAYFALIVFPKVLFNFIQNLQNFSGAGDPVEFIRKLWDTPVPATGILPEGLANLTTDEIVPYAVLATTIVWASAFGEADRAFRRTIQEHALIPAEAQRLVDKLEQQSETFTANATAIEKIVSDNPQSLIKEADFRANNTLPAKYARIEYLYYQLARNSTRRTYSRVFARYREELDVIKKKLKDLRADLVQYRADQLNYMKSLDDHQERELREDGHSSRNGDDKTGESLSLRQTIALMKETEFELDFVKNHFSHLSERLTLEVDSILRSLYQVAVCTALAVGKSPGQRQKFFAELGFEVPETVPQRLGRNTVVIVAIVLIGSIFGPSLIYYAVTKMMAIPANPLVPRNIQDVLSWTFQGCLMHLLAFCIGFLVQRSADHNRERRRQDFFGRSHIQIADYADCFLAGFAANIFLFAAIFLLSGQLDRLHEMWPWAMVPGITAAATGYFIHKVPSTVADCWRRASVQGLCTGMTAGLAIIVTKDITAFLAPSDELIVFTLYAFVTTFILGAGLGAVIQQWSKSMDLPSEASRRASQRRPADAVAEWSSRGTTAAVRIRDISESGAALRDKLTADPGTRGTLSLSEDDVRPAKVVRQDERGFTCLEFVPVETPDLILVPQRPSLAG